MKRDGISAIKFEAAQIHFLSDVFLAVAVVVALTPYYQLKSGEAMLSKKPKYMLRVGVNSTPQE